MELFDFDKFTRPTIIQGRDYGGQSGNKESILINGEYWFLKYPQNLKNRNLKNVVIPYSNAPLSEFLGSQIYDILNVPVHKTLLGVSSSRQKVVVACKDFLNQGDVFIPYGNIKNSISKTDVELSSTSGTLDCSLCDVLTIINRDDNKFSLFKDTIETRFWTMFIIDALIGNTDRNNGNWGIIQRYNGKVELAPIFDNGNSFNNKIDEKKIEECLQDRSKLLNNSYVSATCIFTTNKNGEERRINPHQLIRNCNYENCNKVVLSLTPIIKKNLPYINRLIDDIPLYFENIPIITKAQKTYYKELIINRFNYTLLETYSYLITQEKKL